MTIACVRNALQDTNIIWMQNDGLTVYTQQKRKVLQMKFTNANTLNDVPK